MAEVCRRQPEFIAQFAETATAHIPQAYPLQVAPDAFDGIKFWRVAGQPFQPQPFRCINTRPLIVNALMAER